MTTIDPKILIPLLIARRNARTKEHWNRVDSRETPGYCVAIHSDYQA
jgi:hypothetical protein